MLPGNDKNQSLLYGLDGVSFAVGTRIVLAPLTLQLEPARIYGLVGPNGSGKSTLIKLLARQQAPASGRIDLFGRDIAGHGAREFSRLVAYMPQFTPPAEALTVAELVALGRFPWHGALGAFSETDRSKVADALAQAGIEALSDRLVDTLSGGERQRVWLGMMLAQDAKVLLLDEPTSALDVAHQVEVLALISRLCRESGISVVVILHDINMAARYCDEIIALGEGRLIARGTPDEILQADMLAKIYGVAMGIMPHPVTGTPVSYVI